MVDPVRGEVAEVPDGPEYDVKFRERPDCYRHTAGEEGAFKIRPYKSELLGLWTISELDAAAIGAQSIHQRALTRHRERYGEA